MTGTHLRTLRTQAGLSQEELARKAGLLSRSGRARHDLVCSIENGRTEPKSSQVVALAKALSATLSESYEAVLVLLLPADVEAAAA